MTEYRVKASLKKREPLAKTYSLLASTIALVMKAALVTRNRVFGGRRAGASLSTSRSFLRNLALLLRRLSLRL